MIYRFARFLLATGTCLANWLAAVMAAVRADAAQAAGATPGGCTEVTGMTQTRIIVKDRRALLRRSALVVPVVVAALFATVGSAAAASTAAGHIPPVHVINLHRGFERALSHAHAGKIIIFPPRGRHLRARTGAEGCAEPDHCNMPWHGGPVQHSVQVYLLLWGPNWTSDPSQGASAGYLQSFYAGLGVQPQDTWSTITSQYTDGTGHPSFNGSVLVGTFVDASTPPAGVGPTGLTAEADAFAQLIGIPNGTTDAQIVIATQSGTWPECFDGVNCQPGDGAYCAWHSNTDTNIPFTNLPYLLDAGTDCGEDFVSSPYDGFSMIGGHEYAETITDPYPSSGYWDPNDPYGGEIGDKCAWGGLNWGGSDPYGDVTLSTGTFAMQSLYSNASSSCVMSMTPDKVTLANPGSRSSTLGSGASLQLQASSSTGATLTYQASGLPAGLSINTATGLISGTPARTAATYTVSVTVTDTAGGSASTSFTWAVSSNYGAIHGFHSKCVRANTARTHPEIYSCGQSRETWNFRANGEVHLQGSGCISYQSSTGKLTLASCSPTAARQHWYRQTDHQYVNGAAAVCITDPGSSTTNGTQLVGRACKDNLDQKWSLP